MPGRYAVDTQVPVMQSRMELERTITRYGATSFASAFEPTRAVVMFDMHGRRIRFVIPLPSATDPEFTKSPTGRPRSKTAAQTAWEQACRQKWRALNLAVKAKLEAVESAIAEFEDEFLAYVVLPDGSTMADHARPAIARAYETGTMPALLPGGHSD